MAGLSGNQDNGYSSLEDENDAGPTQQMPAEVIDAILSRMRARANCQEDSFVRHLSISLLSRMTRNIFRRWESISSAADDERVPDFLQLVCEELKQFAQRSEIAEEFERRNSRESLEQSVDSLEVSMSPKKDIGELERSEENVSNPKQKKFDTRSLNSESVELHSSGETNVNDDIERKPESSINTQDAAGIEGTLQSSVEHTSTEHLEMKSLGSSISSLSLDSPSDHQRSEASITSEISKIDMDQNYELPSTGSGTSISSEIDQVGTAQKPELSLQRTERNITPDESSAPSDELLTSIEDNPPTDAAHDAGARSKLSQKDKEQRKKMTRQVVESFTNTQIINLILLKISPTDVLEFLIQLTVSLDRLDRLINGSRNGGSDIVSDSILMQFFKGLEYCRTLFEMGIHFLGPLEEILYDSPSSPVPEIQEHPCRDPKGDA